MITINTVSASKFSYNGINYFKNFTPVVSGNKISVLNTYDACISLTSAPTHFSEYIVNGQTFASVALLQDALLPIIFTKSGLFTTEWGGIGGSISAQADLQNVLNAKADLVAGVVPASQLPSYVDDVLEFANFAAFPTTGETGKIYIALDNNKVYRWSGSAYIEVAANSGVWGAITGTLSNQTDLQTALNAKANDNAVVKLTGNQSIDGQKTFINGFTFWDNPSNNYLGFKISGVDVGGIFFNSTYTQFNTNASGGIIFKNSPSSNLFTISPTGDGEFLGSVTSTSFIKSGGTSSQFLKANGTVDSTSYQPLLTNPITGTGTTNFLSKFTASGTIGNSQIFDNGTNVGIGTTSPTQKLDVNGAIASVNEIFINGSGNTNLFFQKSGINKWIAGYVDSISAFRFSNGSSDVLTLSNGGNVGIGTTSPLALLDINGKSVFGNGSVSSPSISFRNSTNSGLYLTDDGFGALINVGIGATNIATFKYNGNVGIGTTSPSQKLDVNGLINSTNGISVGGDGVSKVWTGTQAAYDAIGTKSSTTIYFIQ